MTHETFEHPHDSANMVLVPAGKFLMGAAETDLLAEEHEKPLREVFVSSYWIDLHPVTNAQFARFLDNGYEDEQSWTPEGWAHKAKQRWKQPLMSKQGGWDGPDQPVAGVSWYE